MRPVNFSPVTKRQVVKMVEDYQGHYTSQWQAIISIAAKIGRSNETVRRWVREHEKEVAGRVSWGVTEKLRVRELEREVIELRRANEILRLASVAPSACVAERRSR